MLCAGCRVMFPTAFQRAVSYCVDSGGAHCLIAPTLQSLHLFTVIFLLVPAVAIPGIGRLHSDSETSRRSTESIALDDVWARKGFV